MVAPDFQEYRRVLGPTQIQHVAHAQVVNIAEGQLGIPQLRHDLQGGVAQLVKDLIRVILAGHLAAHALPVDLTEYAHEHIARQDYAHPPLAAAKGELHVYQHHCLIQVQQGDQGGVDLRALIRKADGHIVLPAAPHELNDIFEQQLIELELKVGIGVAHGDLPLRFPFAAHHPVHHPQRGLRRQVHHHRVLCLNVPSPLCPGVDGYIYHGQYVPFHEGVIELVELLLLNALHLNGACGAQLGVEP